MTPPAWANLAVQIAGWALVHLVWSAVAVYTLYRILRLCLRSATPNHRYVLGCAAMAMICAVPFVTAGVIANRFIESAPADATPRPPNVQVVGGESKTPVMADAGLIVDGVGHVRYERAGDPAVLDRIAMRVEPAIPGLVVIWAIGVVSFAAVQALGMHWIGQGIRRSACVSGDMAKRWAAIAQNTGLKRTVRFLCSDEFVSPLTVGWLKPAVLMPLHLMTQLSAAELDAIIAHELAHVRRYDHLVNQIQGVLETLLFFHPCIWLLSYDIRVDREICCDGEAAERVGSRKAFAETLLNVATFAQRSAGRYALGFTGGSLSTRVHALARPTREHRTGLTALSIAVLAGSLCLTAVGSDFYARARTWNEREYFSRLHESAMVAETLHIGPATAAFRPSLIAALTAARERAPVTDGRYAAFVDACSHGADMDLIWREYVARGLTKSYPTLRSEWPSDWPFADNSARTLLSRALWRQAKLQPASSDRSRVVSAAMIAASMRRELSGIPSLSRIVLDPEFHKVSDFNASTIDRLRRFESVSEDTLATAVTTVAKYREILTHDEREPEKTSRLVESLFSLADRFPELKFVVEAYTRDAVDSPNKREVTRWVRTRYPNEAAGEFVSTSDSGRPASVIDAFNRLQVER